MEFTLRFVIVKSRWSMAYIEGVTGYNFQDNSEFFFLLKNNFVLANSADSDEKLISTAKDPISLTCVINQ